MRRSNPASISATRLLGNRRGIALPIVMAMTLVASVELASLGLYAANQMKQIRREEAYNKAFYVAEGAAQKAMAEVRLYLNTLAVVPDQAAVAAMTANAIGTSGQYTLNNFAVTLGALTNNVAITSGNYTGLVADTQTISITADVKSASAYAPSAVVQQEIQIQQIPVFQFGVFYDNDLEILPGATMTFAGSVHSNANIYMGTSATVTFNSGITAGGDIFHGRKDSVQDMPGAVNIKDGSAVNQNMKNADGTWLDSNDADWTNGSQSRWGGKVKSQVHNTRELNLPVPITDDPRNIIKRRDASDSAATMLEKLDYKAQVRLIDGQIKDQNGTAIVFNYCSTGGSLATCSAANTVKPITFPSQTFSGTCNSSSHFKNVRENKCIKATEVDIVKLNASPKYQQLLTQNPTGIIFYHSDQRNLSSTTYQDGLRLTNGALLKGSTTFASENPVYVKGDFNTSTKKNAGIMADALNILSNSWSDTNSTASLSSRVASNTTVNAAVITGNAETATGNYNGGFENIHRFLENWSSKTITYAGSVGVLYNSAIAKGRWDTANVYNAPNRTWSYDNSLASPTANVPGFPSVINLSLGEWKQDN